MAKHEGQGISSASEGNGGASFATIMGHLKADGQDEVAQPPWKSQRTENVASGAPGASSSDDSAQPHQAVLKTMMDMMQQQQLMMAQMQEFMMLQMKQQAAPHMNHGVPCEPSGQEDKPKAVKDKIDPELIKLMQKQMHKFADEMHKVAKTKRKIKAFEEDIATLNSGQWPPQAKQPKPLQELSEMSLVWKPLIDQNDTLVVKLEKGMSRTEVVQQIHLHALLWTKEICNEAQKEHQVMLEKRVQHDKFIEKLCEIKPDDSLMKTEGLVDVKAAIYAGEPNLIKEKANELWLKCLEEVEKRLKREKETREKKQHIKKENEDKTLGVEPEIQLTTLMRQVATGVLNGEDDDVEDGDVPMTDEGAKKKEEEKKKKAEEAEKANLEKSRQFLQAIKKDEKEPLPRGKGNGTEGTKDVNDKTRKGKGKGKGKAKGKGKNGKKGAGGKGKPKGGKNNTWSGGWKPWKGSWSKNVKSPGAARGHSAVTGPAKSVGSKRGGKGHVTTPSW